MPQLKVLVVCVGNICRSALAERLLQARFDAALPGRVVVSSAGTRASSGRAMDPFAAAQLLRLGGNPGKFEATRLTSDMANAADLVLTATRNLRTDVLRLAPRGMRRTFMMSEFAAICADPGERCATFSELVGWAATKRSLGSDAPDIFDPYGEPLDTHVRIANQIAESAAVIVPRVLSTADSVDG